MKDTLEITYRPLDPGVLRLLAFLSKETDDDLEESFARLMSAMMLTGKILGLSIGDMTETVEDMEPVVDDALEEIETRGIAEIEAAGGAA